MRDIRELTQSLILPSVHVFTQAKPARSHFGGNPNLPEHVAWPVWRERKLDFLARISLEELKGVYRFEWLPETGALLFFYAAEQQPWGYDPDHRGSCAVILVPDLETPPVFERHPSDPEWPIFKYMGFQSFETLPSLLRDTVEDLKLSSEEQNEYVSLSESPFHDLPKHQIGGYPFTMQQDDMELECQLVTNGLYLGDNSGYRDPRAAALTPGAKDWALLFQFDTDDELDVMWGDIGIIYFWVERHEAAQGRFGNSWVVLQCL
jgi:uncharacterized protein YwqG